MEEELQDQEDDIWIVLFHPLNNIEIINHFKYEPIFNGIFSRNSLPRTKDRAYVTNLDDYLFDRNTAAYFDSFGIEYIPQEVLKKIKDKSITHYIP